MTRQQKISSLLNHILDMEYGSLLSHDEISHIIEESKNTYRYRDIVHSTQKQSINFGRMIASVHGIGYRIINPDEYTEQSVKMIVSGAKRINSGANIMNHAPVKDMTEDGITRYNLVGDRLRILQASVEGAKVEIKMLERQRQHPLLSSAK